MTLKRTSTKREKARLKTVKKPIKGVKRGKGGRFKPGTAPGPGRPRKGDSASDFAEQAIGAEEVWSILAKQIRHGSIAAIRTYLEYRHGKPWSEAEVLEDRAIREAQARLEAAARKGDTDGYAETNEGTDFDEESGYNSSTQILHADARGD